MRIEKYTTTSELGDSFQVTLEHTAESMIMDQFADALKEAARHYVDQNMDKITAKLDVSGLGNLIAIYAAKKLASSANE